jgi:hypothetical protein
MSNGPLPACPDDAVDVQWLFSEEQAPSPPLNEGWLINGSHALAHRTRDGVEPAPNPCFFSCLRNIAQCLARLKTSDEALKASTEAFNSLTAMDGRDRPLNNELHW